MLTSKGKPRNIIQDLENHHDDLEEESKDEEYEDNEYEENCDFYSLQKIEILEIFYYIKENQNLFLRKNSLFTH